MKKPSIPTLLYTDTSARRWIQAAITAPDADLECLCVWQWRQAASRSATADFARAPAYVQLLQSAEAGRSSTAQFTSRR